MPMCVVNPLPPPSGASSVEDKCDLDSSPSDRPIFPPDFFLEKNRTERDQTKVCEESGVSRRELDLFEARGQAKSRLALNNLKAPGPQDFHAFKEAQVSHWVGQVSPQHISPRSVDPPFSPGHFAGIGPQ